MSTIKVLKKEKKFCFSCMDEHEISIVALEENLTFKGVNVNFVAEYEYCSNADVYLEDEEQIGKNDLNMKDAYRKYLKLLTSTEIKAIRSKYKISQKEFSEVLGWGSSTIIRYENHQVQDRAHDDILRKIDKDPNWFLEMLNRAKQKLQPKFYMLYLQNVKKLIQKSNNPYSYNINIPSYEIQYISTGIKRREI